MKKIQETEVLIAGGGTSGFCAAIQAARSGARVILVEETPWLGGMLTSAGVSAIDGNH
ncbi:FAD-dependent oxidoreductase, partial [candidate division KSB1 bacterium]|nr:FAD-dependent oxidoreductase [candidate division KSB1 bacterium]